MKTISILMPSYNQSEFIEEAINSVLQQNYEKTELIIVDGGSTDKTTDVIQKYSRYISYFVTEPDRGQTHALNKAYAQATGEIIGWQNSDDFYYPDAFRKVVSVFDDYHCDFVYGNHTSVDKYSRILKRHQNIPLDLKIKIYENTIVYNQSLFWKKTFSDKLYMNQFNGPFNESYNFVMDAELIFRAILNGGKFAYINHELGAFRYHDDSKTSTIHEVFEQEYSELRARLPIEYDPKNEKYLRYIYKIKRQFLKSYAKFSRYPCIR